MRSKGKHNEIAKEREEEKGRRVRRRKRTCRRDGGKLNDR